SPIDRLDLRFLELDVLANHRVVLLEHELVGCALAVLRCRVEEAGVGGRYEPDQLATRFCLLRHGVTPGQDLWHAGPGAGKRCCAPGVPGGSCAAGSGHRRVGPTLPLHGAQRSLLLFVLVERGAPALVARLAPPPPPTHPPPR